LDEHTAQTTRADADRTYWPAVITIVLTGVVSSFNVGKVPPAVADIMVDLGTGKIGVGWVASTLSVVAMTLATAIGMWSDRWGHRRVMIWGMAILALGSLLGAVAQDLTLMIVARVIEGIGYLAYGVSGPSMMLRYSGIRRQRTLLGVWSGYMPGGFALALLLSPWLHDTIGWRGVWIAAGVAAALSVVALGLFTRARSSAPGSIAGLGSAFAETVSNPGILLLAAAFMTYAFQWVSVMVWLPTFLAEEMAASATVAASLTALVVVANVLGNLIGGTLNRLEFRPGNLIMFAMASMGVTSAAVFLLDLSPVPRLALAFAFSCLGGILPATSFATSPRYVRTTDLLAGANGLIAQATNLGMLIGPPLFAWAVTVGGGGWSNVAFVTLPAAALGVLIGLAIRFYRPQAAS